jgi:predicted DNA-binding transcriptional regulator YafY
MYLLERIERLHTIHHRILQEGTGNPEEFAEQLHVSRSHLYNLIGELKDYGAKINYCRKRETFVYLNDFDISEHLPALPCKNKK